jgi:hypothetical protein
MVVRTQEEQRINNLKYGDPANPHEILDTPFGQMEAWRASTLATGSMGAFDTYMKSFREEAARLRADAVTTIKDLEGRKKELDERALQLNDHANKLIDFAGKLATYHEHLKKRDEEQTKFAEEPAQPPGNEPTRGSDEYVAPAGDLHVVEPKHEPELETDQALPKELLETGNYPMDNPEELDEPPEPPSQPVAISLNAAEPRQHEEED